MRRIVSLGMLISFFLCSFAFAERIDPNALAKSLSEYGIKGGALDGQDFWNYAVEDTIKFRVIESLTGTVDEMISEAINNGAMLNHTDPDTQWFCDADEITQALVIEK